MSDSLRALQKLVVAFRDQRDWAQFHQPKDLALGLGIEAGELGELFLWKKEDEVEALLQDPQYRQKLSHELADVQVYLLLLAERTKIDLGQAVVEKMNLNEAKYPVEKARGNARKYTEF
ncbi:MAG: nucleotide pyrophosphohydrolase [Planctomycetota bacterium]|nr:MAG: nucleotide pyrophosphohydrolase [Planctomycetota bacterium]